MTDDELMTKEGKTVEEMRSAQLRTREHYLRHHVKDEMNAERYRALFNKEAKE